MAEETATKRIQLTDKEKEERISFWNSLPESERLRICEWFSSQFGVKYKTSNPSFKPSQPVPSPPVIPGAPLPKLQLSLKSKKKSGLSIR